MLLFLPVCSCPKVGHSQGEEEGCTCFLKSPKASAQNSAPPTRRILATLFPGWLMPRQKDILLMVREDQLLK